MKLILIATIVIFLFSFCKDEQSNRPIQNLMNLESINFVPHSPVIDSSLLFILLQDATEEPIKILSVVDSSLARQLNYDKINMVLTWHHENFYSDEVKEVVLHFHINAYPLDIIYILIKENDNYRIAKPFTFGYEGAYDTEPAIIDIKNKFVLVKSRIWGNCTEGYAWEVYAFKDNGFRHLLSFVGEHGNSTCGTQKTEEVWQITSSHTIYNTDSILFNGMLVYTTFKRADEIGKLSQRSRKQITLKMRYRYDHHQDTFFLYNNRGMQLESNPLWAGDFWKMYNKNEL